MSHRDYAAPMWLADTSEDDWLRFLLTEGLEVLATYRNIRDPAIRAVILEQMKEAVQVQRNAGLGLN